MSLIDTYQIATCGQNFINTFTLASNGILVGITIEPIPVTPPTNLGGIGVPAITPTPTKKEKQKHKITVKAIINGIEYTESVILKTKPNLKVEDIKVDITENKDHKPIIKIMLLKG